MMILILFCKPLLFLDGTVLYYSFFQSR
jgi:hypothetical protein